MSCSSIPFGRSLGAPGGLGLVLVLIGSVSSLLSGPARRAAVQGRCQESLGPENRSGG